MRPDDWLQGFWRELVFSEQSWCRELLFGLAENRFQGASPVIGSELLHAARSLHSTKAIEDSFNILREAERQHRSSKLGRAARWHKCLVSGVLPDCDRRLAEVRADDKGVSCSSLPASLFEAKAVDCTLDDEKQSHFLSEPRAWAAPQLDSFHVCAQFTASLVEFGGDWTKLKSAWLSLLVEPLTFVAKEGANGHLAGVVIDSNHVGMVLWRASPSSQGAARWWSLCPESGPRPFMQCFVQGISDGWRVAELIAVPAAAQPAILGLPADRCPGGIVLIPKAATVPLLRFASGRAFHTLGLKLVKDLLALVRSPGEALQPQPKTEFDWVRCLISEVEPGLEASIIDERIDTWRGRPQPSSWHTTLTEKAAMECDGILEKDDAKDLLAAVRKRAAEKQASVRSTARPRTTRAPRKLVVAHQAEWTREQASQMLPKIAGCNFSKDTTLHYRWKVSYANSSAPYSHSAAWNNKVSQEQALFRCLRWAWTCHEAATGESCPYDID